MRVCEDVMKNFKRKYKSNGCPRNLKNEETNAKIDQKKIAHHNKGILRQLAGRNASKSVYAKTFGTIRKKER